MDEHFFDTRWEKGNIKGEKLMGNNFNESLLVLEFSWDE